MLTLRAIDRRYPQYEPKIIELKINSINDVHFIWLISAALLEGQYKLDPLEMYKLHRYFKWEELVPKKIGLFSNRNECRAASACLKLSHGKMSITEGLAHQHERVRQHALAILKSNSQQ